MPLPRSLGRFNARVTNPLLGPLLRHVPGYGYVEHRGRRSGRTYRTPVLSFRDGDRLTFAATYGPRTEWVRNVLAAGGGTFLQSDRRWRLIEPRLYHDPRRLAVPWFIRPALRLLGAADFLEVRVPPEPDDLADQPDARRGRGAGALLPPLR